MSPQLVGLLTILLFYLFIVTSFLAYCQSVFQETRDNCQFSAISSDHMYTYKRQPVGIALSYFLLIFTENLPLADN